jgi:DNA ligase (NAD+)
MKLGSQIPLLMSLVGYAGNSGVELASAVREFIALDSDAEELKSAAQELAEFLDRCNDLYRSSGRSPLADEDYDALEAALGALTAAVPELQYLAPKELAFHFTHAPKVEHLTPMLSLEKVYSSTDVAKFVGRVQRYLKLPTPTETRLGDIDFVGELKIDGLAFAAVYEEGRYVRGVTRGDGYWGEDMTQQLASSLPQTIDMRGTVEIRGEIFITHADFHEINGSLPEPFSTARNLAAGSLRLLDPKILAQRRLRYFAYSIAAGNTAPTHEETLALLAELGFAVEPHRAVVRDVEGIESYYQQMVAERAAIGYDVDGVVFKVNDLKLQERLGNTSEHPRWAMAYKFGNERRRTKVLSISLQVGRTGAVTPVAELEPVDVKGVTIKRATLHNFVDLAKKDIRVGDCVTIERAGDVIPQIVEVDTAQRDSDSVPFPVPTACPECGSALVQHGDDVVLRCVASMTCPAQLLSKLVHFASKGALNIGGLGVGQLTQLWDAKLIARPRDIFALDFAAIEQLPGWGAKSVANLKSSIEEARTTTLERFIFALSIRHVGKDVAKMLAEYCGSAANFCDWVRNKPEVFSDIDGIGPKVVESLQEFAKEPGNWEEVEILRGYITIRDHDVKTRETKLAGKTIVFTGKLQRVSRDEAKELATRMGARVSSAISSKTDYLVCGEDAGSKLNKAKELGISVLSEEDWVALVGGS